MRTVSGTLATAITAAERTVRLRTSIDWDNDGGNTIACSDTFDGRTVAAGWDTSSDGYTYTLGGTGGTVQASDLAVSGGVGTMSVPVANGFRSAYHTSATLNFADQDILVEWSCPAATGAPLEPCNVHLRLVNTTNFYLTRVYVNADDSVQVVIYAVVTGSTFTILEPTTVPNAAFDPGVHWFTRVQALGPYLRIRVWPATATEPGVWHGVVYDSNHSAGGYGFRAGITTGNTNTKPVVFSVYSITVSTNPYDDVSTKVGQLSIKRALTGHLPGDVLVVEGISAATASGDLAVGDPEDETLDPVRYWSRFNTASPIYGKPRANRSADVAVEFLTSAGWESVPRLTDGVLRSLPVSVKDATASLELIDARDRFRTPITLPAAIADGPWDGVNKPTKPGLEASWIVSYLMWQSGYPLSPVPRTQCVMFNPYHGSAIPFLQSPFAGAAQSQHIHKVGTTGPPYAIRYTDGPFFLAADPRTADGGYIYVKMPCDAVPLDGWDGDGRATAIRIEFRALVTGTEAHIDAARGDLYIDSLSGSSRLRFFVRRDGLLRCQVSNDATTRTVDGPTFTPNTGWHLFGVHVDDVNGRAAFRIDSTTTVVTFTPTPAVPRVQTSAVMTDTTAYAPIAEHHVSMGSGLAEDTPWQPTTFQPIPQVDRLQNRALTGIFPDRPIEAWTLLQQVVGAERALARIDFDGVPVVWSRARLNTSDALNVVRTLTAKSDLLSLSYRDDRDMIRNIIRVPYAPIVATVNAAVWSLTELMSVGGGLTRTFSVKFDAPLGSSAILLDGRANTLAAGGGTGSSFSTLSGSQISATVTLTSPTSADIALRNLTGLTLYIVDSAGVPLLNVYGTKLTKTEVPDIEVSDAASRTRFGDAPLDLTANPWIQDAPFARGTAYQLLALLRDEQVVFDDIEVPGDPRLEPWDRIRIQDPTGLALDTELSVENIDDDFANPGYDMALTARPARDQWILGGPGVGTPIGSTILGGEP